MKWPRKTIEGQAEAVVTEYLERGMVPSQTIEDVTAHLENDEPLRALEEILAARQRCSGKRP